MSGPAQHTPAGGWTCDYLSGDTSPGLVRCGQPAQFVGLRAFRLCILHAALLGVDITRGASQAETIAATHHANRRWAKP